jgi:ligand-binding SRPBCC domain-containing protein
MMMISGRKLCESMPGDAPIRFHHESIVDVSLQRLWSFYMSPDALRRLSPPLSFFRVVDPGAGVANGSLLVATVGPWPLRQRWVALHSGVREEQSFTDIALESPFAHWVHLHSFEPVDDGHSRLIDVVWFLPPRGVPRWAGRLLAAGPLRWMFRWRHRTSARAARAIVTDSKEQPAGAIRRASTEVRT